MQKIRTISKTMQLLKEQDPQTAITERALRDAVKNNRIPHRKVGNKTLLNYDAVCNYFMMGGGSCGKEEAHCSNSGLSH